MSTVTIVGAGNMGAAIAWRVIAGGNDAQVLTRTPLKVAIPGAKHGTVGDPITGDIVVLALPYAAVAEVLAQYEGQLDGKVLVDITNPVDFATFDNLTVPADGSAAAELARELPQSKVVKAFNTNFAGTLATGSVGSETTAVLIAGDDADAKSAVAEFVSAAGLRAVDAGSLKRARELESLAFLQISLAAGEKLSWNGGFAAVA